MNVEDKFAMNVIRVLSLAVLIGGSNVAQAQIPWTNDVAGAQQASQTYDAVVLLHFYSDNCVPCKMLDSRAFRDAEVVAAMKQTVIPVKVNVDQQPEIARKYNVSRWPTDVYLFPDGSELARTVSPQQTADYINLLERVATRNRDFLATRNAKPIPVQATTVATNQQNTFAASYPSSMPQVVVNKASTNSQNQLVSSPVPAANFQLQSSENMYCMAESPHNADANAGQSQWQLTTNYATTSSPQGMALSSQSIVPPNDDPNNAWRSASAQSRSVENTMLAATAPNIQTVSQANPQTLQASSDSIAMGGFCPVSLEEQSQWLPGSSRFAVRHRGRVYHLVSADAQQKFMQSPDRYAPMLGGFDLVHFLKTGKMIDGQRENGCWYKGRVYLFATPENRAYFDADVIEVTQFAESLQAPNSSLPSGEGRVAAAPDESYRR